MPRKIHVDQGTSFMSNEIKAFCNGEGIEIIKPPVNDHRATGASSVPLAVLRILSLPSLKKRIPNPWRKWLNGPLVLLDSRKIQH